MDYYANIFSSDWLWLGNVVFAYVLLRAVMTAPWRSLGRNIEQFNVLIAVSVLLAAFWLLPVGVREGLKLHLLGATLCVLIFDWQIATLLLTVIMLLVELKNGGNLLALGCIGMVMIVLPVMATRLFFRLFQRYGIKSYFSYTWWNGYVCGFLVMALVALSNGLLAWVFGNFIWFTFKQEYLAFLPILCASESILTGALVSGLAVFMPGAVALFDQDVYFPLKPPG